MKRRRIVIASPVEPSGASWILNCLLELGVQVHHRPVEQRVFRDGGSMWIQEGEGFRLHPRAAVLAKWMPALAREGCHRFQDEVEVEYVQDLPSLEPVTRGGVLFVRDPRDAMWSAYNRSQPEVGLEEFLTLPNPRSLLDRACHWALFVRAWLARPGVQSFRFEDYKRDDLATLRTVIAHMGVSFPEGDVARAVAASTFDKAKEAEARYRARHPSDTEVANRAGRVGDFRDRPELATSLSRIEASAGELFERLGYGAGLDGAPSPRGFGLARLLAYYGKVALPPDLLSAAEARDPLTDPSMDAADSFARGVTPESLMRFRLAASEARALLGSLAELSKARDACVCDRLLRTREAFADGGAYHARQIGAMLRSRRAGQH